ncbi:heterokaryon incompatibility protein-domain-containing protein [Boletus edulis BED1]|uniref:Heterokaryon incompatibility protein-domain-containing protein n=1 Tax=Boletus edulis BED1 TaxID=1328754 RepID=A0AAD4GD66_BOLED|nr:heterokaryon incompatibility protein-domain-containing protein [Boletus edulis BED1]
MLLGFIAPKLKEVAGSRNDQKERIILESQSPAPEEKITPAQIVDELAQKMLSGMPLRVINLNTGSFSSSADLLRAFKRSHEYQTLVSDKSLTSEVLAENADDVIRKYFAYVMLSHVWGEDEPLYGDVKLVENILQMSSSSPGVLKLQNFCRIAKQRGFRWCWGDTCCIDKSSSAELQESINSMFTWYRNSALTIAFLLDVLQRTPEALKRSRWFTRGWTLQELLAPTAIEFYMGDWTPFLAPSAGDATPPNYKLVPEFVQCLEDILCIDKSYLVGLNPGLDDVREKLRWVATRTTTKIEDMAYCLLGILDLRLPVLYGEGERAFIRLQDEIMKNTDDTCIFDWVGRPSTLNSYLARSPSCFHQPAWRPSPYQTTAELPMLETVGEFTHKLSAALLRIAESLLDEPPLGHFIANGRMNLRTFVYQVKSVKVVASGEIRKRWVYRYQIKADGLEPVTVVATYQFPDAQLTARSLSIGRVWDNSLRLIPRKTHKKTADEEDEPPADDYNPWTVKSGDYLTVVAKRLREPFVAQLLVAHPNGQFHRVHTEERIVAQPRFTELLDLRTPRTLIVH